jgi:hypothetical protein
MTAGLFDLPAPLFEWLDDRLTAIVPPAVAVAIWAAVAAVLSLELYRLVSPQEKIDRLKTGARAAQRELSTYDGEFEGAAPLIRRVLALSLKRVAIVLPATLLGALPVVVLLVWLSNSYGHRFPAAGEAVTVDVPTPLQAHWIAPVASQPSRVQARERGGRVILDVPVASPVPVLHKRQWWNWLIANPAGYLPVDFQLDEVRIGLPRLEVLPAGPSWIRGWEAVFLPVLFLVALAYKSARRII